MWSSKITLVLALTSVASVRALTKEVYVQAGKTTELRCPMDMNKEKCQWYSSQEEQKGG